MPISDPEIPIHFLHALEEAGVGFVVLHGEQLLGTDALRSDLDLAVDRLPPQVLARVGARLRSEDLVPVLLWPYDIAGAVGVFVGSRMSGRGAQIDLLSDARGRGRYGLRTDVLLADREDGVRFPVPNPLDQDLYLLRKAAAKGKLGAAAAIATSLEGRKAEALGRAGVLFSAAAAVHVRSLLGGVASNGPTRPVRTVANAWRMLRRAVRPVGRWVELVGADSDAAIEGRELADLLAAWLLRVETGPRPRSVLAAFRWWWREVLPVKLRAGVFVSWSGTARWPRPDVSLALAPGVPVSQLIARVIDALGARAPR